ncbi:MAG TPA: hypothetical protein VEC06_01860 [Paucimonas sp.]|nr:hypothetical protein [Paucimonas sp.]
MFCCHRSFTDPGNFRIGDSPSDKLDDSVEDSDAAAMDLPEWDLDSIVRNVEARNQLAGEDERSIFAIENDGEEYRDAASDVERNNQSDDDIRFVVRERRHDAEALSDSSAEELFHVHSDFESESARCRPDSAERRIREKPLSTNGAGSTTALSRTDFPTSGDMREDRRTDLSIPYVLHIYDLMSALFFIKSSLAGAGSSGVNILNQMLALPLLGDGAQSVLAFVNAQRQVDNASDKLRHYKEGCERAAFLLDKYRHCPIAEREECARSLADCLESLLGHCVANADLEDATKERLRTLTGMMRDATVDPTAVVSYIESIVKGKESFLVGVGGTIFGSILVGFNGLLHHIQGSIEFMQAAENIEEIDAARERLKRATDKVLFRLHQKGGDDQSSLARIVYWLKEHLAQVLSDDKFFARWKLSHGMIRMGVGNLGILFFAVGLAVGGPFGAAAGAALSGSYLLWAVIRARILDAKAAAIQETNIRNEYEFSRYSEKHALWHNPKWVLSRFVEALKDGGDILADWLSETGIDTRVSRILRVFAKSPREAQSQEHVPPDVPARKGLYPTAGMTDMLGQYLFKGGILRRAAGDLERHVQTAIKGLRSNSGKRLDALVELSRVATFADVGRWEKMLASDEQGVLARREMEVCFSMGEKSNWDQCAPEFLRTIYRDPDHPQHQYVKKFIDGAGLFLPENASVPIEARIERIIGANSLKRRLAASASADDLPTAASLTAWKDLVARYGESWSGRAWPAEFEHCGSLENLAGFDVGVNARWIKANIAYDQLVEAGDPDLTLAWLTEKNPLRRAAARLFLQNCPGMDQAIVDGSIARLEMPDKTLDGADRRKLKEKLQGKVRDALQGTYTKVEYLYPATIYEDMLKPNGRVPDNDWDRDNLKLIQELLRETAKFCTGNIEENSLQHIQGALRFKQAQIDLECARERNGSLDGGLLQKLLLSGDSYQVAGARHYLHSLASDIGPQENGFLPRIGFSRDSLQDLAENAAYLLDRDVSATRKRPIENDVKRIIAGEMQCHKLRGMSTADLLGKGRSFPGEVTRVLKERIVAAPGEDTERAIQFWLYAYRNGAAKDKACAVQACDYACGKRTETPTAPWSTKLALKVFRGSSDSHKRYLLEYFERTQSDHKNMIDSIFKDESAVNQKTFEDKVRLFNLFYNTKHSEKLMMQGASRAAKDVAWAEFFDTFTSAYLGPSMTCRTAPGELKIATKARKLIHEPDHRKFADKVVDLLRAKDAESEKIKNELLKSSLRLHPELMAWWAEALAANKNSAKRVREDICRFRSASEMERKGWFEGIGGIDAFLAQKAEHHYDPVFLSKQLKRGKRVDFVKAVLVGNYLSLDDFNKVAMNRPPVATTASVIRNHHTVMATASSWLRRRPSIGKLFNWLRDDKNGIRRQTAHRYLQLQNIDEDSIQSLEAHGEVGKFEQRLFEFLNPNRKRNHGLEVGSTIAY